MNGQREGPTNSATKRQKNHSLGSNIRAKDHINNKHMVIYLFRNNFYFQLQTHLFQLRTFIS